MFSTKQTFKVTWKNFDLNKVELFRDPTWESYIPRDEFVQIYGSLLETFNGSDMSSYVDFFFRPSPVNKTIYEFVDEDSRLDFREMAEDMNLIPKLKEIMEGEDEVDKVKRFELENVKKKSSTRNSTSNNKGKKEKKIYFPRTEQIKQTIDRLVKLLENETDPAVRKKLEEKLTRTLELSQKTM